MNEKETKIKMRQCVVCGKEFNIYTRPPLARFSCSEECRAVNRARRQEAYKEANKKRKEKQRKKRKNALIILLVVSIFTGIIGAMVGAYIYDAMNMVRGLEMVILIGFAVGFFAPFLIYFYEEFG